MIRIVVSLARSVWLAIIHDPEIKRLAEKHPIFFRFLKNRLTSDETFGLHLTLGIAATSLCIYFFFGFVHDLIGDDSIFESDTALLNLLQFLRNGSINPLMVYITYLGSWFAISWGTAVMAAFMAMINRRNYLIAFLSSYFVSGIAVIMINRLFEYTRPPIVNIGIHTSGFSVPSGQVFAAISFYGLAAYVWYRLCKRWMQKIFILFFTSIFLVILSFSRVYLGLEWPADVVAGVASGIAWLSILITILEIHRTAHDGHKPSLRLPPTRRFAYGAVGFAAWIMLVSLYYLAHPFNATIIPEQTIAIRRDEIPNQLFDTLPRYSETLFGKPTEPLNIIIIGKPNVLDNAFERAGWIRSYPITAQNLWSALVASIRNTQDLRAPVTPQFWNTFPSALSYIKSTPKNSVRERHHIRFWNSSVKTLRGEEIYFGAASFDKNIKFKSSILIPTHVINPAIDVERDYVSSDLEKTGLVESEKIFQIVDPILGKNIVGDQFFTDGKSRVIFLKDPNESAITN